jgi:hypothetical protein
MPAVYYMNYIIDYQVIKKLYLIESPEFYLRNYLIHQK